MLDPALFGRKLSIKNKDRRLRWTIGAVMGGISRSDGIMGAESGRIMQMKTQFPHRGTLIEVDTRRPSPHDGPPVQFPAAGVRPNHWLTARDSWSCP
jgi:hypothetical protein